MWVLSVLLQWDWHMHQYCFFKFSCLPLFESLSMDGRRGCFADKQEIHMWTSPQRTLTLASLSSDNLGASGVERHMWAPTKLHQHWSAAALRGDVLPCNTLLDFFMSSLTLLFVTHYQNPGKKSTNRRVWKQNYQRGHRAEYRAVTSGSINLNTVSFSPFLFQQQQWETELWDPMCANFTI